MAPTDVVGNAIESSKFGFYQIYTLLVCWGALFADGGEMLVISLISSEMGKTFKWNKSDTNHYVGLLGSMTFFGFLLGSLGGGKLIDIWGRRLPFVTFNFVTFVFGLASAFAPSFWYLGMCRFITGLGVGGSIPCATAILAEICPNKQRKILILTKTIGFVFGEILIGLEAQVILPKGIPTQTWRQLLVVASLPALVAFFLSLFFLDESPRFLELNIGFMEEQVKKKDDDDGVLSEKIKNMRTQLVDVLKKIAAKNEWGRSMCCPCFSKPALLTASEEKDIVSAPFRRRGKQGEIMELFRSPPTQPDRTRVTILLFFIWFAQSYMYYGVIFTFPITLTHSGESAHGMTGQVVFAAFGELLGALSAIFLVELPFFGTRRLLMFEEVLAVITFFLCAWMAALPEKTPNRAIIFFWFVFSSKIWTNGAFDLVFPYTAEYYPTRLRGTGLGYGSAAARVGGIITPYAALQLHEKMGRHAPYVNFGIAGIVGVMFIYFLPEVRGLYNESDRPEENAGAGNEEDHLPLLSQQDGGDDV
jgi:MFS family permease